MQRFTLSKASVSQQVSIQKIVEIVERDGYVLVPFVSWLGWSFCFNASCAGE